MQRKLVTTIIALAAIAGGMGCATGGDGPIDGAWRVAKIQIAGHHGTMALDDPQPGICLFRDGYYSMIWRPRDEPAKGYATMWRQSAGEAAEAYSSIILDSGTFELSDTTLTTHPIVSKAPEMTGGRAIYSCKLDGDTLRIGMLEAYAHDGSGDPALRYAKMTLRLVRAD